LSVVLQKNVHLDAVVISETTQQGAEHVAEMARRCSPMPVMLFRRSQRPIDEKKLDEIYSCLTPLDFWLHEAVALIVKGTS
jgi:hypothetical protein